MTLSELLHLCGSHLPPHGIIRRGRESNSMYGSTLQVGPGLLCSSEYTSRLYSVFVTSIASCDTEGISLLEHGDGLPFDDEYLLTLSHDCAVELAVNGVILEHVNHVVDVSEWSLMVTVPASQS